MRAPAVAPALRGREGSACPCAPARVRRNLRQDAAAAHDTACRGVAKMPGSGGCGDEPDLLRGDLPEPCLRNAADLMPTFSNLAAALILAAGAWWSSAAMLSGPDFPVAARRFAEANAALCLVLGWVVRTIRGTGTGGGAVGWDRLAGFQLCALVVPGDIAPGAGNTIRGPGRGAGGCRLHRCRTVPLLYRAAGLGGRLGWRCPCRYRRGLTG